MAAPPALIEDSTRHVPSTETLSPEIHDPLVERVDPSDPVDPTEKVLRAVTPPHVESHPPITVSPHADMTEPVIMGPAREAEPSNPVQAYAESVPSPNTDSEMEHDPPKNAESPTENPVRTTVNPVISTASANVANCLTAKPSSVVILPSAATLPFKAVDPSQESAFPKTAAKRTDSCAHVEEPVVDESDPSMLSPSARETLFPIRVVNPTLSRA